MRKIVEYRLETEDGELLDAIKELEKILPFRVSEDGYPVELRTEGKGLFVSKENAKRQICCEDVQKIFRGIFLLIRNEDKEHFSIHESAGFKELGMMVDCSRNAVPKKETIFHLIRHLAVMGYNVLQLYTEDTLVIEEEPYFGYMRGAYNPAEIREIDDYCKQFHIELVPCIQTLAHLNQITRYECYHDIIDVNDILLVGEERTYELIEHIIASVSKNFTSTKINIGMDEAHMLGLGKYLDRYGYQNRFQIMITHLERVLALCRKYNLEPQMWSDMFFRLLSGGEYKIAKESFDNAIFDQVPKDVRLIYWDYYSDDKAHYDENFKMHNQITPNLGFAAGAWKWSGFAPDNAHSIATGTPGIKACKEAGVSNFMVTSWADNGAEGALFSVLPALYFYGEMAGNEDWEKEGFSTLTGIEFDAYMQLDFPNVPARDTGGRNNANKYLLYNDVLLGSFDDLVTDEMPEQYDAFAKQLKETAESAGEYSYLFDTMACLCEILSKKVKLGPRLKAAYDQKDKRAIQKIAEEELPELIELLDEFTDAFTRSWHRENKSFGFEVQNIRLGGLKARLEYISTRLRAYVSGEIAEVEELEIDRLPFSYAEGYIDRNHVHINKWSEIVSTNIMG